VKAKKIFIIALSFACIFTSLSVNSAISVHAASTDISAAPSVTSPQSDVAHGIYDFNNSSTTKSSATTNDLVSSSLVSSNDLICAVQLTLTRDSSTSLNVYGNTTSDSAMSEIGFTNITIQREVNGTWQNYAQWSNLYGYNTFSHSEDKTINVQTGYYYRAIANHYAEKPWFLWMNYTQTYYNETSALYM